MEVQQDKYDPPGPVSEAFLRSDAFVRGIRGPLGSGKSTCCVFELVRRAQQQAPGPDGKRRTRWAVIRNTYPELKTTTIKTWHQWVSPEVGKWVDQGPPRHHIIDMDVDMEVLFLALDSENDIKKLLSLELTGAWVNEARELPKAVLDGLTGRVGRYPAKRDGGATWSGIIMDTNAPDDEHWWAKLADFPDDEQLRNTLEAERELREMGALGPNQPLYEFFSQPSGFSDKAENKENLPLGYYVKAKAGKRDDWVKVYLENNYGFVVEGQAIIPEYRDNLHCKPFELNPRLPIHIGIDFGLTPAAIFGQKTMTGQWKVHSELCTFSMGAVRFGELLNATIKERYPNYQIGSITGDPAGDSRAQTDETTPFQILAAQNIHAQPAHTNDFTIRREAWAVPLSRLIDGEPGMLVHPQCKFVRKGLSGGYHYKKLGQVGHERLKEKPEKNEYSHPIEAGGYMLLGGGEGKAIVRRTRPAGGLPRVADTSYNIFG